MSHCPNCTTYQAEITRLKAENTRLRQVLSALAQYCYVAAADSASKMQTHLSRGEWSYLKGRGELAGAIYQRLRQ